MRNRFKHFNQEMLSISAPSKFLLTLHSIPPFFSESVLAFVLVVLLAVPLIARVRLILENPINYFGQIASPQLPRKSANVPNNRCTTIAEAIMSPSPVISVNFKLDTIRPIKSSSTLHRNISSNFDVELIHANCNAITNFIDCANKNDSIENDNNSLGDVHDYEYYRHKFIELNLKRQFGDCIPGNVVLNSQHLNAIDSKMIVKVKRKFANDLFDFLEYPEEKKTGKERVDLAEQFFVKSSGKKKDETIDKSVETIISHPTDPDHLPELITFPGRSLKKRKLPLSTSETQPKSLAPKKLPTTSSQPTSPQKAGKKPALKRKAVSQRPKEPLRQVVPEIDDQQAQRNERSSVACSSVVSSEALSFTSTVSRQPEHSRPTSSCGSRGFRAFRPRVNSRPRSGGCFGWDIPDADSNSIERPNSAFSSGTLSPVPRPESFPDNLQPAIDSFIDFCDVPVIDTESDLSKLKTEEKNHKSRLPVRQADVSGKLKLFKDKKKVKTGEMGSQIEYSELNDKKIRGQLQGEMREGVQGNFQRNFVNKLNDKKMTDFSASEQTVLNFAHKINHSATQYSGEVRDSDGNELIEINS